MLQFLIAIVPIVWLIIALTGLKMEGYKACGAAVLIAALLGCLRFGMHIDEAVTAALEGALTALWPILMVILSALFVYDLTLKTGAMEKIKAMLAGVSTNRMIILLVIGWGFGNFMEGMAGFGTAVAIPAGILVAMGYDPLPTVTALLVVNSTPTAFGSVGVPTTTLSSVTGLDVMSLCGGIVKIQFLLTFIAPFILIAIAGGGIRALKGLWHIALISSLSFVLPQYLTAVFIGPELPDIIGSVFCMALTILTALVYEKRHGAAAPGIQAAESIDVKDALRQWSPFILIFVILLLTSPLFPFLHDPIAAAATSVTVYAGKNPGTLRFAWLDCPGVKIIIAGFIGGLIQGAKPAQILQVFLRTVKSNIRTILTICSVLAAAKIMGYSGMIGAMAAFLVASTGRIYPLISPLIGMIGGFVTGSGTSTTVLFGALQAQTAEAISVDPVWLASANMLGAGVGKMISPQGIAIGCAASGLGGKESTVLTRVVRFGLIYIVIGGIICFIGA